MMGDAEPQAPSTARLPRARCRSYAAWAGRMVMPALLAVLGVGCRAGPPQALGTLEFDRITLPAPAAERIVRIDVHEGQHVAAGAPLMQLDTVRAQSQWAAADAQARQAREALQELQAGPREEEIAQARALLAAAQAQAADARAYHARLQPLQRQRLVAAAEVDRAGAAAGNADAQVRAARAALLELERGTRGERIAQGQAALAAAQAQAAAEVATLGKLHLVAPRAAQVESLPYKLGDQAPVGAPLAILLVGDAPYARIYVPETWRANVQVGDRVRIWIDGREHAYVGHIRMIRSEPSFTPYYALMGKDAARLSYLAEVALAGDAAGLPAGLPVRAEFQARPGRADEDSARPEPDAVRSPDAAHVRDKVVP